MYIRARRPIRVVSHHIVRRVCLCGCGGSVCFVFVGLSADRFNKFAPCILVARGQQRANVNWAPGSPGAVKRYLFFSIFHFPFYFFPPKKKKNQCLSSSRVLRPWGGLWAGSRMMGGQARKKRRAMGYTLKETICWTIERERESRASGGLLTDLLALFHPLTRARFSLFPWLNSAWPFLSYYLWGPTKKLAARQQRNPI